MRWALLAILLAVTPALGAPLSGGLLDSIHGPASGAYEIPLYGADQEIWYVFRAPDNHLVLGFVYKKNGLLQSDLYDTASGQRAYPDLERKAATDNSVSDSYIRTHKLTRISTDLFTSASNSRSVYIWDHGGNLCSSNPYMVGFKAGPNWDDEFYLFQKLPHPLHRKLRGYCGSDTVTYRHSDRTAQFYSNKNGFFAQIDRFLIWFDWDLKSEFLKGRDDYIVVPATALEQARKTSTRNDGEAFGTATIREMDDIIMQYGARQLKEKKHV